MELMREKKEPLLVGGATSNGKYEKEVNQIILQDVQWKQLKTGIVLF